MLLAFFCFVFASGSIFCFWLLYDTGEGGVGDGVVILGVIMGWTCIVLDCCGGGGDDVLLSHIYSIFVWAADPLWINVWGFEQGPGLVRSKGGGGWRLMRAHFEYGDLYRVLCLSDDSFLLRSAYRVWENLFKSKGWNDNEDSNCLKDQSLRERGNSPPPPHGAALWECLSLHGQLDGWWWVIARGKLREKKTISLDVIFNQPKKYELNIDKDMEILTSH